MVRFLKKFLEIEAASGIFLLLAAIAGVMIANSQWSPYYFAYRQPLILPVNDGLMAIFFWLVGMEIRREMTVGELSSMKKAALPLFGALGGVVAPALIYLWFNRTPPASYGWAIPSATDIAFSLGVLALFAKRVPVALKIFLLALATIDDIAAILIIAFYYTAHIEWLALLAAGGLILLLRKCAREEVLHPIPYIALGMLLWVAVHESGVHATVAGVILGLLIPRRVGEKMIHALHGWVAFGIIPLFAFVNSGLSLEGMMDVAQLMQPVPLGIALGLCIGKPVGIMLACLLLVRLGKTSLPQGVSWGQMLGVSWLAGIGFTMSLFIGFLSFSKPEMQDFVRLGVVVGSLVSAMLGAFILWVCTPHEKKN